VTALVVGAGCTVAFLLVCAAYPLPIVLGTQPVPGALGLGILAGLATLASMTPAPMRHPSLEMSAVQLHRVFAWWLTLGLACMLLALGSWRTWGTIAFFAAVVIALKCVSVFGFIKSRYTFRVWLPFAAIIGFVMLFGVVVLFLGRSNVPPPITAAVAAYGAGPVDPLDPPSRDAPDLSAVGLTLETSGDERVGGLPVTMLRYRDERGDVVDVYEASVGFPAPPGASRADPGGWTIRFEDLRLRAAVTDRHVLIVSSSNELSAAAMKALAG
jgi:hypothetical protein